MTMIDTTGGGAPENSTLRGFYQNNRININRFRSIERTDRKETAFTLAEVLITLGIIGVVAAMTLPTLINNKQNRELETALKKNYSAIQQAFQMMSVDYGEKIVPTTFDHMEFKDKFKKQFRYAKDCGQVSCVPHDSDNDSDGNVITFITKNYRNYSNTNYIKSWYFDDGQFLLNDGAMIFIEHPNEGAVPSPTLWISVDVNGLNKKPNKWGHDLFTFQLMKDGKLLPMGGPDTVHKKEDYCNFSYTNVLNGIGCTYPALTDKNYWKNLPK